MNDDDDDKHRNADTLIWNLILISVATHGEWLIRIIWAIPRETPKDVKVCGRFRNLYYY